MLEIYTKEGWLPITNRQNYYTSYEYDGTQTLCFDILPSDEMYRYIANETPVRNEENRYLIKDINKRKTACTITCSLDMDDWHQNEPYLNTKDIAKFQTKSLSEILEAIKPSGWSILNAGIRDYRRTPEMEDASDYEVLFKCQEIFSVTYEIRTLDKQIFVKDPEQVVDKGIYITPQLNLESVTMKGNSKDFATRITAYGKQNEDGSYVNFASINGGKTYVEDNKYAGKAHPIWIVWKDERYTIPENLLADAKKKLKEQAYPVLSFEVTVNDLAETDDRYSFLKMGLYDIAHVIIDEHTEIIEKVIKLQRYHDSLEKNKITLSSEPQTITGKVNDAISILGNDGEKLKGSVLQQAQEMAMKLINAWAEKGYIYQTQNEIYILDALPKENAKYCIRMNLGGIAFSQNGWQGPYNSAWTIDGKFNADFITAGTLRGIRITNGNNFNVDANGNVTANGLKATNAEITGKIKGGSIEGDTSISVGTDLRVGDNLYLGTNAGNSKSIWFNDSTYIQRINGSDGLALYMKASDSVSISSSTGSTRISSGSNYINLMSLNGRGNVIYIGAGVVMLDTDFFHPQDDNRTELGGYSARFTRLYATNASISTSDRNFKKDIHDIDERYVRMYKNLHPVCYKHKNINKSDKHDRIHTGFIAQDVEEAATDAGLTPMEFAAICIDKDQKSKGNIYGLAYEEFIALNTLMIQKLMGRVELLERQISELKEGV
ncbi:phage tail protein [[Clostridium] innocuum]|nr:phage tail protein [[Clostridium] innocuum]